VRFRVPPPHASQDAAPGLSLGLGLMGPRRLRPAVSSSRALSEGICTGVRTRLCPAETGPVRDRAKLPGNSHIPYTRRGKILHQTGLVKTDHLGSLKDGDKLIQSILQGLSLSTYWESVGHRSSYGVCHFYRLVEPSLRDMDTASTGHLQYLTKNSEAMFVGHDRKVLDANECFNDLGSEVLLHERLIRHASAPFPTAFPPSRDPSPHPSYKTLHAVLDSPCPMRTDNLKR